MSTLWFSLSLTHVTDEDTEVPRVSICLNLIVPKQWGWALNSCLQVPREGKLSSHGREMWVDIHTDSPSESDTHPQ